ncbi:MAG: hypothetical protein HKP58_05575, partial [Desulfatitalea sp.]|nr:hypothetical protein [Desulfatitalea sp.]NNJ99864.1 hypothetical protein [Desulfatitalea sp.]
MNISDTNTVIASTAPLHPQKISEQSHPSTNQKGGVSNDGGLGKTADVAPSSERILYNKIEGVNAQAHTMVTQIREVDDTMDAVSKNVQQMKVALDHIVKSYPPYPKGSNERIHALRQFGGLR